MVGCSDMTRQGPGLPSLVLAGVWMEVCALELPLSWLPMNGQLRVGQTRCDTVHANVTLHVPCTGSGLVKGSHCDQEPGIDVFGLAPSWSTPMLRSLRGNTHQRTVV